MQNWSLVEVLWTLVALIGVYYSTRNVYDGFADLKSLGELKNGRRIVAVGNIRRDVFRLTIQAIYLAIGLVAGFTPASRAPANLALAIVVGVVFIFTSVLLTLSAFYDHQDRIKLLTPENKIKYATRKQRKDDTSG